MRAMVGLLAMCMVTAGYAQQVRTTLKDQQRLMITIYNDNLALVKDRRELELPKGELQLAFRDVSAQIRPETALLRSLNQPGKLFLLEQNFDFDLLTPDKLLEKYVGRSIEVVRMNPATGEQTHVPAKVLSANQGVVLEIDGRLETGLPERVIYPDLPANLRDKPTLSMWLDNQGDVSQQLELSYLTRGLGWRADYVAELSHDASTLDLSGWVTLSNRSGSRYADARLQLVAGEVNQVAAVSRQNRGGAEMLAMAAPPMMEQQALLEYHLYTLSRPTTLEDNQSKQVALLSAQQVAVSKRLLIQGADYYYRGQYAHLGQPLKAAVMLEFENREQQGLGVPLPKGVVRVYQRDAQGNAQFVGEDRIAHTPRNERLSLKLGNAFDVVAEKHQTDFRKLSAQMYESEYQLEVRNAKDEAVVVDVQEPIPGEWRMLLENVPHKKLDSRTALWQLTVPARGSVKLNYRVQVKN